MMRVLADEHFPLPSVYRHRVSGFDIAAVVEDAPSSDDWTVFNRAVHEAHILLTFDADFGQMAARAGGGAFVFDAAGPFAGSVLIVARHVAYQEVLPPFCSADHVLGEVI